MTVQKARPIAEERHMRQRVGIVRLAVLAALASLVFSFGAFPALAADAKPKTGGAMIVGIAGDPGILNGSISANLVEKTVSSNVFSLLIRLDKQFNPVPDLAESWTISPDGLTYTFNLRKGVKWHDGKPFSSEDVKFTVEDVILPLHSRGAAYKAAIGAVETPDANTVIFRLNQPFGSLMNALGYDFFILPKHLYAGTDIRNNEYNAKPVGTGPFKFAEWKKGSHIILERYADYHESGKPYLDRLIFQVIPDAAGRVLALESGDIDYLAYQSVPSSSVARLKANPKLVVSTEGFESLASIGIMTINVESPILKDPRVRKALAYAMDKKVIAERADYGIGIPATGPIASTSWAYEPDVEKYPHNLKEAARLLDEAGYPLKDGSRFTIRVVVDAGVEFNRKAAEILKEQFAAAGVRLDLQLVERNVMLDRVYIKRDFDTQIHVFSTGADPAIDVARLYISSNIRPVNFTNGSAYSNPEVDRLFNEGQTAFKTEDRATAYRAVQKILADELPCIWLVETGIVGVWNKKFHNAHTWSSYSYYTFWDVWSDDGK